MGDQFSKSSNNHSKAHAIETESVNEFDLLDLIKFLRRNFVYLLWGTLLGLAIALILAVLLPKQYEAKALIKIGQIGNLTTIGLPIESGLQVVDRINSQSFQDTVLEALGVSTEDDDDKLVKQFRRNLKVRLEKSELISLSLRALSRAEAVAIMQEVIKQLNIIHNGMLQPTVSRLKTELESVNSEIKMADIESKQLMKALEAQSDKLTDTKFSQTVLLNSLRMSKDQEYRSFKDTKSILEEKLSPERTFATHLIGRVEVIKKPVFPKYSIFGSAGLFLGLIASLLYILFKGLNLNVKKS